MINVRQKTPEAISNEKSLYEYGAAIAKGLPMKVCKTYLTKKDGTRVNTNDLTEDQILGLVYNDLVAYSSSQGSYKTTGRTGLDSFKLAEALLEENYTPSISATLQMAQMEQQFGHIVRDLMGSFGALKHYDKAKYVAQFQKETNGDFSQVQTDEVVSVLEQMAVNEMTRNNFKAK